MLAALQPGLPSTRTSPAERLAFIQEHLLLWWGGWLLWHAAALSLLALYVALAGLWWTRAPIRCRLAVLCATAGLAADLSGQALHMAVSPGLSTEAFVAAEGTFEVLTGYVGNGLYTLAGLLIVAAGWGHLPRRLAALSAPVWLAGIGLSIASLTHWPEGQFYSAGLLVPALAVWSLLIGRWLKFSEFESP